MMIPGIITEQMVWGHLEKNVNIGKRQCEYKTKSCQKATGYCYDDQVDRPDEMREIKCTLILAKHLEKSPMIHLKIS